MSLLERLREVVMGRRLLLGEGRIAELLQQRAEQLERRIPPLGEFVERFEPGKRIRRVLEGSER